MPIDIIISIAVISLVFIIIYKDLLFGSTKHEQEYDDEPTTSKKSNRSKEVVGYEDVEFNRDIQESISVPLSQGEIDVLLGKIGNVDSKGKPKKNSKQKVTTMSKKKEKSSRFNTLKFLALYGFNIVALAAVSHQYSDGYVTKALDKLATIGGSIAQIILSIVSLGISIGYSLIDSLAITVINKYDIFAEKYLTSKLFETGALIGIILGYMFINSIIMNKLINTSSILSKIGILINFAIMILTVTLLVGAILDLYGKTPALGVF